MIQQPGDVSTLVMSGDPSATPDTGTSVNLSEMTVLTDGSPAEVTVGGVCRFC